MEKYEHVFNALESIVVDIQLELNESESAEHKALARIERSFLSNVVDLLHEARKYREQIEKES